MEQRITLPCYCTGPCQFFKVPCFVTVIDSYAIARNVKQCTEAPCGLHQFPCSNILCSTPHQELTSAQCSNLLQSSAASVALLRMSLTPSPSFTFQGCPVTSAFPYPCWCQAKDSSSSNIRRQPSVHLGIVTSVCLIPQRQWLIFPLLHFPFLYMELCHQFQCWKGECYQLCLHSLCRGGLHKLFRYASVSQLSPPSRVEAIKTSSISTCHLSPARPCFQ